MSRVKILSEETIRKIAAGEVINRPASVVKELIENALDAQSQKIIIELKEGGKNLIKVIDDGIGMFREDVRLAIQRHATSKLTTIDDLKTLKSYGFRGEALASIAAVSRIRIETNTDEKSTGTFLSAEAGNITEIKEIARARGTTITVQTLFYNLPVRRGFLKSDSYELKLIIETLRAYALIYPEIAFSLYNDGKEILVLPKVSTIKERLKLFLEKSVFSSLFEFRFDNPIISFWGYISAPETAKTFYEIQQVVFNQRPVRNRTVSKAIYEGYAGTLRGNNPNFIVFLETSPENLDVNIHPTKQEVRFADERFLYDFISEAIRKTLGLKRREELSEETTLFQSRFIETEGMPQGFWQLHNSYIFAQVQTGYCVIDQHAAAERIIFEDILRQDDKTDTQGLLFPIIMELTPEEFSIYEEIKETLSSLGIETKVFSGRSVVVESVPSSANLTKNDIQEFFLELTRVDKKQLSFKEEIAKLIACKGAVKANQRLSQPEMEALINKLFACKDPYFCPHGRPTIIKISREELDKKFGR
ncbi:MAG: DNA mismatch repair endonuclease MutL [candidate division WOR-3 bacterium]|nr:DNA mismatch repair endonuclease MutL [candidate division WOR-3 bacterium]